MNLHVSNSSYNRERLENLSPSQSRTYGTYGPLLGLLLVNLISRVVSAKYSPFASFPFATHDPNPWLAYNKAVPVYQINPQIHYPQWYPIKNPYHYDPSIFQTYPTLTTETPHQVEIPHQHPIMSSENYYNEQYENIEGEESQIVTTLATPISNKPKPAASSNNKRRVQYRKRTTPRQRAPEKRRRTTPEPDYYDSYEDYSNRRKPSYSDNYYDDEYDDDFRPRRRTTPRSKFRRRTSTSNYEYDDYDNHRTEIMILRQRQSTTTEPTTSITNGTTEGTTEKTTTENPSTTQNSSFGYYGPSNGNEGISITYGPPYYYPDPYNNWYTHDTRNSVVRQVQGVVGAPDYYQRKLRV